MKEKMSIYLIIGIIFLSFSYAIANQNSEIDKDPSAMINVKAKLIKYYRDWSRCEWKGDTHIQYKCNVVSFQVTGPSIYNGKEIAIEGFKDAEFDSYWKFESKKGTFYSLDVPSDFFSHGYSMIDRKQIRNLKEITR